MREIIFLAASIFVVLLHDSAILDDPSSRKRIRVSEGEGFERENVLWENIKQKKENSNNRKEKLLAGISLITPMKDFLDINYLCQFIKRYSSSSQPDWAGFPRKHLHWNLFGPLRLPEPVSTKHHNIISGLKTYTFLCFYGRKFIHFFHYIFPQKKDACNACFWRDEQ